MIFEIYGLTYQNEIDNAIKCGADWIAIDFSRNAKTKIPMLPSRCGIIPDYPDSQLHKRVESASIGIFKNEMPQNIITQVYNYQLDIIQFNGNENATIIKNIKATIAPDIRKDLKIIKEIAIAGENDFKVCKEYYDCVDYFIFNFTSDFNDKWQLLEKYDGQTPYLIKGVITDEDITNISNNEFRMCIGISSDNLNKLK